MSAPLLRPGDAALLGALLREPRSLSNLRSDLGIAPEQLHGFLGRMTALGCTIEQAGVDAFHITHTDLAVWPEYLEHVLAEAGSPRQVLVYRRTASTQDLARACGRRPVAVLADEQSAGRGRLGRRWFAPPGRSVLLSLNHPWPAQDDLTADGLQTYVAVALAQALERLVGQGTIGIKWPNDLVIDGRKLAGILIETASPLVVPASGAPEVPADSALAAAASRLAVIGLGINVAPWEPEAPTGAEAPAEVRARAISLRELGCDMDRLAVAAAAIVGIDRLLQAPHPDLLRDAWRCRNVLRDQRVCFACQGRSLWGTVQDIDLREGLIVRDDAGHLVALPAATTSVVAM